MGYKILLFDIDDTLLDFSAIEAVSLPLLFGLHGVVFSDEVSGVYKAVNRRLWSAYENGTIGLAEVLNTRFSETMKKLGVPVDGALWEKDYQRLLDCGDKLTEGALEVCRGLAVSHRLFAVTNGLAAAQVKRLKRAGLLPYFEDVFVSESIGCQKPSRKFFDYVADHIRGYAAGEALVIGDSPNTDIRGGILSGIDTCWVNRNAQPCPPGVKSTYTIRRLTELFDLCK